MTSGKSTITTHLSRSQFKAARPEEEAESLMGLLAGLAAMMPRMTLSWAGAISCRAHTLSRGCSPSEQLASAVGSLPRCLLLPDFWNRSCLYGVGRRGAWCVSGVYNYTFIELVQSKLKLQAKSSLLEGFNKEFPPENGALHHLPSVSGGFPAFCRVTPILTTLVAGYSKCLAVSLSSIELIVSVCSRYQKTE